MTTDFAEIGEFIVTRKERVELDPFECVICERTIRDDQWSSRYSQNMPPVCGYCARHWGKQGRPSKITRGDYLAMQRLKAVTERLRWEIHNGKRAQ